MSLDKRGIEKERGGERGGGRDRAEKRGMGEWREKVRKKILRKGSTTKS